MTQPLTLTYSSQATLGDIAAVQTLAAAGPLVLTASPFLMDSSTLREVALFSTDNNSAVNFTIVGTDLSGLPITEILAGPNNNTVVSTKTYASIVSITASAACTNVNASVGDGQTGWILTRGTINTSWSITVTGTIEYEIQTTNSRVYIANPLNSSQIIQNPACNPQVTAVTAEAASTVYIAQVPCNGVRAVVTGGDDTGALLIEILDSPANAL